MVWRLSMGLRLAAFAACVLPGACASAGLAIGGEAARERVLAQAPAPKLAAALSAKLAQPGAPALPGAQIAALRGLLEERAPHAPLAALQGELPALSAAVVIPAQVFAAPAPPVRYAVELGRFETPALAAAIWGEMAAFDGAAVAGLTPRVAGAGPVRLLAGPLAHEDEALGRCTAFAALGMSCKPARFEGKALPGPGGAV